MSRIGMNDTLDRSVCLSGAVPVVLSQDNTCNLGFLCMNNTIKNPPEFCAPTTACFITRLQMLHNTCAEPQGYHEPIVCPAGFYCPAGGQQQIICPSGHYCPLGSWNPIRCATMSVCPESSVRQFPMVGFLCILLLDGLLLALMVSSAARKLINKWVSAKKAKIFRSQTKLSDMEGAPLPDDRGIEALSGNDHADIPQDDLEVARFIRSMASHTVGRVFSVQFEFRDLEFSSKNGPLILSKVSGKISQGSLWGIMGPSGAGKSTFVNLLLGKIKQTSGSISINGVGKEDCNFKKLIGFVPQDDIILPELTVRENILHSARIRLGTSWTEQLIQQHVDALISCLRLAHVQHSLVGDAAKRGISGGQRKRASIALELAAAPKVLVLDEPTSGLDATAALSIIKLLKELCRHGVTIICIIHQPRGEIFEALDELLLLSAGRQVYMGHRSECVQYFESKGFVFPSRCNPADILMDIISGHGREYNQSAPAEPAELSALLIADWEAVQLDSASPRDRDQNAPDSSENTEFLSDLAQYDGSRGAPWYLQVFLCFLRGIRQQARQTTSFIMEISVGSIAGLLIGLSVYKIEGFLFQGVFRHPFELLSSAANYTLVPELGLLCSLAIGLAAAPPGVKCFGEEKLIYRRESESGHSRSAYFVGKSLSTIFRLFLSALHYTTFYMILATPVIDFGMLLCINTLYFYCIYGLTSIVAAITRREDGPLMAMVVSLIIGVFGGYGPPLSTVKSWHLHWFWYMCPGTWLSEAYFNEHTAPFSHLYDIDAAAAWTGYTTGRTGMDLAMLLVIGTVYRVLAYAALVTPSQRILPV